MILKKLYYGVGFLVVWSISVGVTAHLLNALQAKDQKSTPAWVDHPNAESIQQPTILTKHELFSEDHTADVLAIEQVWAAYGYYNDSHNGPGIASLFLPNAVVHFVWNNLTRGGKVVDSLPPLVPHYGIVAPADVGKNMTPEGEKGSGCVLHGRGQIEQYYGLNRLPVLPWPGHGHHESTAMMVKVSDDGQTAVLSTPYVIAGVNEKGEGHVSTGGYRVFFQKTPEGWEVAEAYGIDDHPHVTPVCDIKGPFDMRKKTTTPQT